MTSSGLTIALALGAIHWFAIESQVAKARNKNGYQEYPIASGLKFLTIALYPMLIYGTVENYLTPGSDKWISGLLIVALFFCIYFLPATIVCSSEYLISIRWYGLRKTSMNWSDVIGVFSNPEDNSIIVRDKFDRTIVHTMYNIDRPGFVSQIKSLPARELDHIAIRL